MNFEALPLRPNELSRIRGITRSAISQKYKRSKEAEVQNNRLISIPPSLVEKELEDDRNKDIFNKTFIGISANICGGSAKSVGAISLGSAYSRLTTNNVIWIDCDPQASLSHTIMGEPKPFDMPILCDYLEGKCELKDIIESVGEKTFIIRSSLNNTFLDRAISSLKDQSDKGLMLLEGLRKILGENVGIFIDTSPQISNILNTLIIGANKLSGSVQRVVFNPIRADRYSMNGSLILQNEIEDNLKALNMENKVKIITYFSMLDRRISATQEAYKEAVENEALRKNLSPIAIRYSSEILKSISQNQSIYGNKQSLKSPVANDYMDLLLTSIGYNNNEWAVQ